MAYDTTTRMFEIYSENVTLEGFKTIEIQGYFKDHPLMTSEAPNLQTLIEIEDPCLRPASITAPTQTNPDDYFYTEDGANFIVSPPLTNDPPICPITFECISISGQNSNLSCEDSDAVTFDELTGELAF